MTRNFEESCNNFLNFKHLKFFLVIVVFMCVYMFQRTLVLGLIADTKFNL